MTIKAFGTGSLSLSEIQSEFGGSNPISMSEYYRGGYVPANGTNIGTIPASGSISVSSFYGTSIYVAPPTLRYTNAFKTTSGSDTILTFKQSGSITLGAAITLRGLVVGGGGMGGSAGNDRSGGGGGGGVSDGTASVPAGAYSITVGAGTKNVVAGYDKYGNPYYTVSNSTGSSIGNLLSSGGGNNGTNGQGNYGFGATGGASGSPQNNAGGPNGGGGGGAGAAAINANGYNASPGGAGATSDISGSSTYYGGGGGGGAASGAGGAGGGGGAGGYQVAGSNGTDGLGGGGGGSGGYAVGGSGGNGLVIVRGAMSSVFGGFYVAIPNNAGGVGENFYRIVAYWTNDTGISQTVNLSGSVDTGDTKTLNVRGKVSTDFSVPQTGLNAGGADSPPSPYWSFGNSGNGKGRGARSISLARNSVVIPAGYSIIVEAYLWGAYNSDHVTGTYLQVSA